MSDPRQTPFNGRIAHSSLEGQVEADRFTDGTLYTVAQSITDICRSPEGPRDRQLLLGQGFLVLDIRDGWCYGLSVYDGYCGWVDVEAMAPASEALTHRVWVRETYARAEPDLKFTGWDTPLYLGAAVRVEGVENGWSKIGPNRYVPSAHLKHLDDAERDLVEVAREFIGTPYLWGGNSGRGIDCSGLIQAAFRACNLPCPGDSDMQEKMPGQPLFSGTALEPGDLVFWKGHVAMATGPETLIHANAHHMAVVEEKTATALKRIGASDTGEVTSCLRPSRLPG